MKGTVDNGGRALITVALRKSVNAVEVPISVWIDTGFTGDLVLPAILIERLALEASGSVDAILADGSQIELSTYSCLIDWFGQTKSLEIIANDGECPLLGVGLLLGLQLRIDYRNLRLELERAKKDGDSEG
jgi:clan AA aspartic protease